MIIPREWLAHLDRPQEVTSDADRNTFLMHKDVKCRYKKIDIGHKTYNPEKWNKESSVDTVRANVLVIFLLL